MSKIHAFAAVLFIVAWAPGCLGKSDYCVALAFENQSNRAVNAAWALHPFVAHPDRANVSRPTTGVELGAPGQGNANLTAFRVVQWPTRPTSLVVYHANFTYFWDFQANKKGDPTVAAQFYDHSVGFVERAGKPKEPCPK